MIYIAHRGLHDGPDSVNENHPNQIMKSVELGFDCEVDIWYVDNKLVLGHDKPNYEINEYWLRNNHLWIHCKNSEALEWFQNCKYWSYNYFWHEDDNYTLTSHGYIWAHPKSKLLASCIMVMPEHIDPTLNNALHAECYGICSDYVNKLKQMRNL